MTQDYQHGNMVLLKVLHSAKHYWEQLQLIEKLYLAHDAMDAPVASAFVYDKLEQGAFYTWAYDANTMWLVEQLLFMMVVVQVYNLG